MFLFERKNTPNKLGEIYIIFFFRLKDVYSLFTKKKKIKCFFVSYNKKKAEIHLTSFMEMTTNVTEYFIVNC